MDAELKGPWSREQVETYLAESVYPLRLACIGADGFPRVVSVWYRYCEGRLYGATHKASQLAALLQANARVGFEVATNEPPYFGVRGQGLVELGSEGGGDILEALLERYLGGVESSLGHWLLSRKDDELLVTLEPRRLFSWDYRERMNG